MDGPRLSPVFLKHKFLSGVEEIMKLEENVENQKPLTWKSLLTFLVFFLLTAVGNSGRWENILQEGDCTTARTVELGPMQGKSQAPKSLKCNWGKCEITSWGREWLNASHTH